MQGVVVTLRRIEMLSSELYHHLEHDLTQRGDDSEADCGSCQVEALLRMSEKIFEHINQDKD